MKVVYFITKELSIFRIAQTDVLAALSPGPILSLISNLGRSQFNLNLKRRISPGKEVYVLIYESKVQIFGKIIIDLLQTQQN